MAHSDDPSKPDPAQPGQQEAPVDDPATDASSADESSGTGHEAGLPETPVEARSGRTDVDDQLAPEGADPASAPQAQAATTEADADGDGGRRGPADSAFPEMLRRLPETARPYAALARWDRPVGIWLLTLPCWMGLAGARIPDGLTWHDPFWAIWFLIGATAMRGAGCTWNDIADRDLDAGVARTAGRPLPAGEVSLTQAIGWLIAQLAVGFLVWLALPVDAKIVAVLALPLVALYPFMKRVTWWPQAWLGATMNWGVLVGAATATHVSPATVILWLGLACWTIAYDTVYALQDREDDALMGVKSTARLFGDRAVLGAFCFHMAAAALAALAALAMGAPRIGAVAALLFLAHGAWQAVRVSRGRDRQALVVFKSNVWAGAILAAGFVIAAILS